MNWEVRNDQQNQSFMVLIFMLNQAEDSLHPFGQGEGGQTSKGVTVNHTAHILGGL